MSSFWQSVKRAASRDRGISRERGESEERSRRSKSTDEPTTKRSRSSSRPRDTFHQRVGSFFSRKSRRDEHEGENKENENKENELVNGDGEKTEGENKEGENDEGEKEEPTYEEIKEKVGDEEVVKEEGKKEEVEGAGDELKTKTNAKKSLTKRFSAPPLKMPQFPQQMKMPNVKMPQMPANMKVPQMPANMKMPQMPANMKMPQFSSSSFYKGIRSGSLPKQFRQSKTDPPTPAPTPSSSREHSTEPQDRYADAGESPSASPTLKVKNVKKRAASASPCRRQANNEKRMSFRGISRERLAAPFPAPIRNFILKPPRPPSVKEKEKIPNKPSRRPGPVGRTWIKVVDTYNKKKRSFRVYDDITYMDEGEDELYPVLPHTGKPPVCPEPVPLPTAPTPPPPRNSGEKYIRSDVSCFDEPEDNKKSEGTSFARTLVNRGRDLTRFKGLRQKRTGTPVVIDRDTSELDADLENLEDDYIVPGELLPPKPPRGNKIYEGVVLKKSTETLDKTEDETEPERPIRGIKIYEDVILRKKEELSRSQELLNEESEIKAEVAIESETKMDSDEVKPSDDVGEKPTEEQTENQIDPQRPARGIKVYEEILFKRKSIDVDQLITSDVTTEVKEETEEIKSDATCEESVKSEETVVAQTSEDVTVAVKEVTADLVQEESVTEVINMETKITESEVTVINENVPEEVSLPTKPERGIKIYDTVILKPKVELETQAPQNTEETKLDENVVENIENEIIVSEEPLPEKPTRGIKIYDTVEFKKETPEVKEVDKKIEVETVQSMPGHEQEPANNVDNVNEVTIAETSEITSDTELYPGKPERGNKIYATITFKKQNDIEETWPEPDVKPIMPPYATVQKDNKTKKLMDIDDMSAPPVPPKLREVNQHTIFMEMPPKPPRHLKPSKKSRSLDVSPSRSYCLGVNDAQCNGSRDISPSRPPRGSKIYATVNIRARPDRPKRHSKMVMIEDLENMKDFSKTLPARPKRYTKDNTRAIPPRRRNKSLSEDEILNDKEAKITGRLTLDHSKPQSTVIMYTSPDTYENVEIKDGKVASIPRGRSRPLPPPPPIPKKDKNQDNLNTDLIGGEPPVSHPSRTGAESNDKHSNDVVGVSCSSDFVSSGSVSDNTSSALDVDIDHNLKNIESSFATLDNVLKSLQSYSRTSSPARPPKLVSIWKRKKGVRKVSAKYVFHVFALLLLEGKENFLQLAIQIKMNIPLINNYF